MLIIYINITTPYEICISPLFYSIGIDVSNRELLYTRILFDDSMEVQMRARLSTKLCAVQAHLDIEAALAPLDAHDAELEKSEKRGKNKALVGFSNIKSLTSKLLWSYNSSC